MQSRLDALRLRIGSLEARPFRLGSGWQDRLAADDNAQVAKFRRFFLAERPHGEEARRIVEALRTRSVAEVTPQVDYSAARARQRANVERWGERRGNAVKRSERYLRFTHFVRNGALKGFDGIPQLFKERPVTRAARLGDPEVAEFDGTMLATGGGYLDGFYQTMLSMFLRPYLKALAHPEIEFHVLCQGLQFSVHDLDRCWGTSEDEASGEVTTRRNYYHKSMELLNSTAFQKIREEPIRKDIRRICTWIDINQHVCLMVLDEFVQDGAKRFAVCTIDNMDDRAKFSPRLFQDGFERAMLHLKLVRSAREVTFTTIPFNSDAVPCTRTFDCTSHMAQFTLIACTVKGLLLNGLHPRMAFSTDPPLMAYKYREFEIALWEFYNVQTERGGIVLLPPDLDCDYVESRWVSLVVMGQDSELKYYQYDATIRWFMEYEARDEDGEPDAPGACAVSARFRALLPV